MRRFVTITPKRGKPAKPKEPSKVPKPKKTRADADPPSEYGADDYADLMDHNEREDRSCSPENDFEIPAQPEGDDFSSSAYRKWFGEAFAGLHFYKAAFRSVNRRLDRVEAQHQRLDREVTESFDSQNARIVALERQLLAINSDKQARILDDSINSSLSTLIIYDPLKVPKLKPDTECNKQEKLTAALVDVMIVRREALVKENPMKNYPPMVPPHHLAYLRKNPDKPTQPVLLRFSDPRAASFARQLLSVKGDKNVVIGRIKDTAYQDYLPFSLRLGYALKAGGLTPYYNVVPVVYDRAAKPRILPQLQILINGQRTIVRCAAPKSDHEAKQLVANAIRLQFELEQPMIDNIVTRIAQLSPCSPQQPRVPQPNHKKRDNSHLTPPVRGAESDN